MTTLADSLTSDKQDNQAAPKLNLLVDRGDHGQPANSLPSDSDLCSYANLCLSETASPLLDEVSSVEVSVQCLNPEGMQALNAQYRGKHAPTNVLSFPAEIPVLEVPDQQSGGFLVLGDLVFCEEVIQREAREQNKTLATHWAHMFIHGFLHLLGYDHESSEEAEQMESLEVQVLSKLGMKNPYLVDPT